MIVAERMDDLIHHLPPVRGDLQEDAPLGAFTWFRTGEPPKLCSARLTLKTCRVF